MNVGFSADGKTLVSASRDKTARLWEVGSGNATACFTGHEREVWEADDEIVPGSWWMRCDQAEERSNELTVGAGRALTDPHQWKDCPFFPLGV